MKTKLIYLFMITWLVWSCSSENSDDIEEQGFSFEISGDINKTISSKNAFFSTRVTQDNVFGLDIYTLVVSANDSNGDQVNIGISQRENVGAGTYDIVLTIEPLYNGFVNYSEGPNNGKPIFGPIGGGITLNSVNSEMVSGSIDAQCQIPGQTNTVRVKGTFKALVGSN